MKRLSQFLVLALIVGVGAGAGAALAAAKTINGCEIKPYTTCRFVDLTGAVLSRADLSYADLTGSGLSGAVLSGADLSHAVLIGTQLREANLALANLSYAHLDSATLTGAYLAGARPIGAYLRDANLSRANLSGAHLSGAHLDSALLTQANLTLANLPRAHLDSALLTLADLRAVDLTAADLTSADLTSADLTRADLTRADLTRADLTRADLTRAIFCRTRMPDRSLNNSGCQGLRRPTAESQRTVSGPSSVVPGRVYTFHVSGFIAGEKVYPTVLPVSCPRSSERCEQSPCSRCGVTRIGRSGAATIRFRWPKTSRYVVANMVFRHYRWQRRSSALIRIDLASTRVPRGCKRMPSLTANPQAGSIVCAETVAQIR